MPEIIGVDISGRHEEDGEYLMVAAAVHARVGATRIASIEGMGLSSVREGPTLEATLDLVAQAIGTLPDPPTGTIVSERGEFYEEPERIVALHFQQEFKYVETIGERETVQAAHHAAYAARKLLRR
ncbi:DUF2209 family protein [Halopenitus sp. H-Gu1]|uniref:DUF2209 family protein n=1 Tax=Halopenitus sp. H-Gu1 TaxID=3242697 RepID=UPI00359E8A36